MAQQDLQAFIKSLQKIPGAVQGLYGNVPGQIAKEIPSGYGSTAEVQQIAQQELAKQYQLQQSMMNNFLQALLANSPADSSSSYRHSGGMGGGGAILNPGAIASGGSFLGASEARKNYRGLGSLNPNNQADWQQPNSPIRDMQKAVQQAYALKQMASPGGYQFDSRFMNDRDMLSNLQWTPQQMISFGQTMTNQGQQPYGGANQNYNPLANPFSSPSVNRFKPMQGFRVY